MISEPCSECRNVFWVDDNKIAPEMIRKGKGLAVMPQCNGSGLRHSFQAFATFEVLGTEHMAYFDLRHHEE